MISLTNNKDLKPEDFPSDIKGLRMTKQRHEVLAVILRDRDHPTANDVFLQRLEGTADHAVVELLGQGFLGR